MVGAAALFGQRQLACHAAQCLRAGQMIPPHHAARLHACRDADAPYLVALRVHTGFIKQRHIPGDQRRAGGLRFALHVADDQRVQDALQPLARGGIGKDHLAKGAAVERIAVKYLVAKGGTDGGQRLAAGGGQAAGNRIRIQHGNAALAQQPRHIGFAAGDAACQPQHIRFIWFHTSCSRSLPRPPAARTARPHAPCSRAAAAPRARPRPAGLR